MEDGDTLEYNGLPAILLTWSIKMIALDFDHTRWEEQESKVHRPGAAQRVRRTPRPRPRRALQLQRALHAVRRGVVDMRRGRALEPPHAGVHEARVRAARGSAERQGRPGPRRRRREAHVQPGLRAGRRLGLGLLRREGLELDSCTAL